MKYATNCPLTTPISLLQGKWKINIIGLLFERDWRFNELCQRLDGISPKVLRETLLQLEADQLITRTVCSEAPPHVEYSVSELGRKMEPFLREMTKFGTVYLQTVNMNQAELSTEG